MNVLDCVAGSVDDYIRIALKLGTDRKFQSDVRDKIREASDRLFEDSDVVRDWEEFFREVVPRDRCLQSPLCASSEDGIARTVPDGPNSPEAHRRLAQGLCRENRFQEAVESYAHVLRLDDSFTEAYRELGRLMCVLGETEGAVACCLQAITLEPGHLETRCFLGRMLEQQHRFDEAAILFEEVLQIDPNVAEAYFGLGRILLAGQRLAESQTRYEQGLQIDRDDAPAWQNLGSIHHALGRTKEALDCYERAVLLKPDYASAHYNLGNALSELGRLEEARTSFQRALELDPEYAEAHNNIGATFVRSGRWDQAAVSFRRASKLRPDDASIHANLGRALAESGRVDEAVASLHRAIEIDPGNGVMHCTLAKMLHGHGCFEEAIASYKNSLAADGSDARVHYLLGNALKEDERFEEAIASYQRAIEIMPGLVRAHYDIGNARNRLGRLDQARESYEQVLKIDPQHCGALICLGNIHKTQDNLAQAADCYRCVLRALPQKGVWDLWIAALCPTVFDSTAEIENYRRGLLDELIRLRSANIRLDANEIVGYACPPPYELPFHGLDDRQIKEAFASVFANCFPSDPPTVGSGRPRIGILVTDGHEGVFLRCMQGILERIRPELFELVLICSRNGLAKIRNKHALEALDTLTISHRVDQAAEAIRAAKFDVLYYWEIGSDVTNYFLPSFRPAGLQCTAWGVPETSGIFQMDYFRSSELVEIEAADDHYTERLLRASTLLTWQERIEEPRNRAGRDKFGLAADANLYVCLQHLRKVHPDFDRLAAEIIERDQRAIVVLVEDRHGYAARKLRGRFERTIPNAAGRVVFVPYQTLENFRCLVAAADVILDTPHFGGGLTTYDAFSLHKPIVTLPSRFRRGRYAQACYRMMGITECIASTPGEYVDIATRLGANTDARRAVSRKIEEASPVLFRNEQAVREYERLFSYLVEQARSR
jgi:tetratricopeptide (TPR) repeat protein